ncbi:MAG TPA: alpha/beta fold hydrolase, partial [Ktedonobacterales bacterium]|nr:alpha/beta fold hydrolase [Ktedonobacterales bacterium]
DYMVPAAFVLLDHLPLTPNGKVDRRALPAPDRTHIDAESAHVEPRTSVEQQLTGIWEELLGIHPISVRDNFFDMGGHSLLAARLMARIQKAFGINLPLTMLFERATIEDLARTIEQPDVPERWSSLVAIRASGTKLPFFCVHGIFGDVLFYSELALYLDADRPLYGLRARGLDGTQEPCMGIEEMAASYIEEIRALQPDGPYYLGGYSSGGSVAYEMARQLAASGQEVALVALFDHANPRSRYEKVVWSRAYPLRFLKNLAANVPYWFSMFWRSNSDRRFKLALQRAQMTRRALGALVKYRGHTSSGGGSNDASFMAHIMETPGLEYVHEWPEYRFRVLDAQRRALATYVPAVYSGRVSLFRARRQLVFCAHDPTLGWGPMVLGGVEIIEVPGAHHSMLHDPYVQGLAAALNASWSEVADAKNDAEEEAAVELAPANTSGSS